MHLRMSTRLVMRLLVNYAAVKRSVSLHHYNNSMWLLVLCRERRRRSRSPPRRGSGRGRGPVTPTVGEIPPQPSESHVESHS